MLQKYVTNYIQSLDAGAPTNEYVPKTELQDVSVADDLYNQEEVYQSDLNFPDMMQQMQFNSLDNTFFENEDINSILPSLDSTTGDHWSGLLSTMLNGSQYL